MELNRLKQLAGLKESVSSDKRVTREAFIYLDPKDPKKKFANCETCIQFGTENERCLILPDIEVKPEWSCGLYVHGEPKKKVIPLKLVTAKEAGLIKQEVRCENCFYYDTEGSSECVLYQDLNKKLPDLFDLELKVHPQGCCNAWVAKKASAPQE